MVKFLRRLTNTILVLFGIASAIGLVYTIFPEYFQFAFETIGLSEDQIGMATVLMAGITTFGSMSKYLSGVVKTQQVLHEQENAQALRRIEETHRAEIEQIRSEKNEETKIYTGVINELIDRHNENNDLLKDIVQVQAITARRNANSDSKLISSTDKELYRKFLEGLQSGEDLIEVENLYTTLTIETIKEEEKQLETEEVDQLSERL